MCLVRLGLAQGTLRGRNATAGSVNAIPWKPGLGIEEAHVQVGYGNFDEVSLEGVVNLPIGEKAALRVAGYHLSHDSYYENITPCSDELGLDIPTCAEEGIGVAEAVDDLGVRATFLTKPVDNLTLTLTADYLENAGTGYTGTNFALTTRAKCLAERLHQVKMSNITELKGISFMKGMAGMRNISDHSEIFLITETSQHRRRRILKGRQNF